MAGALAWLTDIFVLAGTLTVFVWLWRPAMRRSRRWRATVTPVASIIGSGFLVVAPLLGDTVGNWALLGMLGIVSLAYAVGAAVRYNIRHVEEISDAGKTGDIVQWLLVWMERAAKIALAIAYVIAITFYLELLAAFVLRLFDAQNQVAQKLIATTLIVFIGGFGFWRGLGQLESLEKYAVDSKLAIIFGFLVGLAIVNGHDLLAGTWSLSEASVEWSATTVRELLGAFLIVQGFETSRYMGNVYNAEERIESMRRAQLLSALIYLVFIGLTSIFLAGLGPISETGVIELAARVAPILPAMLVLGAVLAQFSAAVADTLASGGLVETATHGAIHHRKVYLAVMLLAIGLLWSSHIFAIIAYASRAFAGYYAIQCAMAAVHSALAGERRILPAIGFSALSLAMILAAVFGLPAETRN